uniref:Ovule protein n=1 Tax=Steinernema glaseri TaxID=37863 RepID=A0A1I7YIL9_9BILA
MQTQSVKKTTLLHVFKAVGQEAVKMGRRTRISIQYFVTTVSGCPYMRHSKPSFGETQGQTAEDQRSTG